MHEKKAELAVVIPVYNEEEIIQSILAEWTRTLDRLGINYELHVYNDGSGDESLAVIRKFAGGRERIFIHDKENSGHGSTILLGYRENLDKPWIFQVDSDGEMPPEFFPRLWNRKDDFDFLIGRRDNRRSPLSRRIISLVSRLTVRWFYGKGVYDVNAPYRLMRTSVLKEYILAIPPDSFAPNVVISGIAGMKKLRIYEIPVNHTFRRTGQVSIRRFKLFKGALKAFLQTLKIRFTLNCVREGK